MRILIVCDSFKGSLSATEISKVLLEGILHIKGNYDFSIKPISDGGEGSLEILMKNKSLKKQSVKCVDPLNRQIIAEYAISKDGSAYIESASTCGLTLMNKEERNPLFTSSKGLGIMINDAIQKGASKIHLFLGGTGTSDGGAGMMSELGVEFYGEEGKIIIPCGGNLLRIKRINIPENPVFRNITFYIWSDVVNPLLGSNGSTLIYAPQKGAKKEDLPGLEEGMKKL
jgi:glycerate kinase